MVRICVVEACGSDYYPDCGLSFHRHLKQDEWITSLAAAESSESPLSMARPTARRGVRARADARLRRRRAVVCVRRSSLVALRCVCFLRFTFIASAAAEASAVRRRSAASVRAAQRGEAIARGAHRPQDGQRAAAGARAARRGADACPPEAALGPAFLAAAPRGARRRRQARCHLPQGARHTQQAHSGEVPKAER